uniref:Uncharacterized protein n=1 Tax=Syphacia muris TaxID=451379 RepID=A0A0N5A9R7_9BILA
MRYSRTAWEESVIGLTEFQPLMGDLNTGGSSSRDDIFLLPVSSPSSSHRFNHCNMFRCCWGLFRRRRAVHSRTIRVGHGPISGPLYAFPPNVVCNRKYNVFTFVPLVCFF